MENLGQVEKAIIQYLSYHRNSLIKPVYESINKDRKTVNSAFQNLKKKKGLIQTGKMVKTKTNNIYQGYELSETGINIAILLNTDLDKLSINYSENIILKEYRKLINISSNKELACKIVRKATQTALIQEDMEKVMQKPDFLMDMAFGMMEFYGNLPEKQKMAVKEMKTSLEKNKNLKKVINDSKELVNKKLSKIG